VYGGGGSFPTQKDAKIFLWDPEARKVVFEAVPVPGARSVTNLAASPGGLVFGIADSTMFVFDPAERRITHSRPLPFPGEAVPNAMALGPGGRIWGLAGHPGAGIFSIDTGTFAATLEARAPRPITGGFALDGDRLYFTCGATLYRYVLPGAGGR
jgi:hypothetical protein